MYFSKLQKYILVYTYENRQSAVDRTFFHCFILQRKRSQKLPSKKLSRKALNGSSEKNCFLDTAYGLRVNGLSKVSNLRKKEDPYQKNLIFIGFFILQIMHFC